MSEEFPKIVCICQAVVKSGSETPSVATYGNGSSGEGTHLDLVHIANCMIEFNGSSLLKSWSD